MSSYLEQRRLRKEGLLPKLSTKKEPKPLKKVSDKRAAEIKEQKELGDTELVIFFKKAMKRMTGCCLNCPKSTEKHIYSAAIFSIAHILDKRDTMFPSVKDNLNNWVELCPDCHREFDSTPLEPNKTLWDKRQEMGIWPVVWNKLLLVYPSIMQDELHHLPTNLRERIEKVIGHHS